MHIAVDCQGKDIKTRLPERIGGKGSEQGLLLIEIWLHLSVVPKSTGKEAGRIKFTDEPNLNIQGFASGNAGSRMTDVEKPYAVLIDIKWTVLRGSNGNCKETRKAYCCNGNSKLGTKICKVRFLAEALCETQTISFSEE